MTKFTKMSLIAALAVAGTTASAQPLTEAIKNVDVSGTVAYRYNDYEDNAKDGSAATPKTAATDDNSATNNYKIALNLKSKVNDDITANTRFIIGSQTGPAGLGTSNQADTQVNVRLSEVNFTYSGVQNLSVTVGKQGIATPWTIARDAMGDEQTGTGILSTYTAGPVTLVGAYFNQTNFNQAETGSLNAIKNKDEVNEITSNINGDEDIYVIGALASFAGINAELFYADLEDTFDAYTIALSGSFDLGSVNIAPFARYSELDPEGQLADYLGTNDDQELWQLGLTAKMGIFTGFIAYGESDDNGGLVFIDSGASTNMDYHWRVTADGSADTEYLYIHATADITDKISAGLYYSEADYRSGDDVDEIYAQVGYQMSKNFSTYVRFGEYDENTDEDGAMGRVHVQYTF